MIKNIIIALLSIWAFGATFLFFACRKMMNDYIQNSEPRVDPHDKSYLDKKTELFNFVSMKAIKQSVEDKK